jgi:radical SAM enzyme (TIGR01210 family)
MSHSSIERDRWVVSLRPPRNVVDPRRPVGFLLEEERSEEGTPVSVATVFLANRECPWRCVMCDLWKNTVAETVPIGAIPAQIDEALAGLAKAGPHPRQIKLYNSGSFFDPHAIPVEDHAAIAERMRPFERVIVECHPALVREPVLRFRDRHAAQLEVAMGLETVDPAVLPKLNKRMSLEQFAQASAFLREADIALRVFILVQPPFQARADAVGWAARSIDFAFACGASVATLIPTRFGNGALEALAAEGEFSPPDLETLEAAAEYGVRLRRGRVFADLWDLEKFSRCPACFEERRRRLERMNLRQDVEPRSPCPACGHGRVGEAPHDT